VGLKIGAGIPDIAPKTQSPPGREVTEFSLTQCNFKLPWATVSAGITKPGEVGEILALYRLKSLSLVFKAKLSRLVSFCKSLFSCKLSSFYGKDD
jgi:hypothetical protein